MLKRRDPKKTSKLGMSENEAEIRGWNAAVDKCIEIVSSYDGSGWNYATQKELELINKASFDFKKVKIK